MAAAEPQCSLTEQVSTAIGDTFSDPHVGKVVAAFLQVLSVLGVSAPPMDNLTVSLVQEENTASVNGGTNFTTYGNQYVVFDLTHPDGSALTYKYHAGILNCLFEDDGDHDFSSDVLTLHDPSGKPLDSDSALGAIAEDEEEGCGNLTMSDINERFYFLIPGNKFADAVLRIHQYFSKEGLTKAASCSAE